MKYQGSEIKQQTQQPFNHFIHLLHA